MSDPINWLQSTKKLCQVVIENREQRPPVPLKEEVTATYPELQELMESIQMHHLKEDDVILIKGLQQHSEVAADELQSSSEGVMCLSPSPSYNRSSVFSSLRKYALGFQRAINAITRYVRDVSIQNTEKTDHIPVASISLPDAMTAQVINLSAPDVETSLHDVPIPAVDIPPLPTSRQLCQQNLVQSIPSFVQPASCHPPEDIQSSYVATDMDVGTPSNLSTFAEWMANEILSSVNEDSVLRGTKPTFLHLKQPEVRTSSKGKFSSEVVSQDIIPDSDLNQTFPDGEESLKSSQDYLRSSKPAESERNPEVLECGSGNAPPSGVANLASREASSIIQKSFQEIGIGREKPLADYVSRTINVNSSGEPVAMVLPIVENYALSLTQEIIFDSTRRASLERKVKSNNAEPLEEECKDSHFAHLEPHKGKPFDLLEMQLSQSDIGTHELDHLPRTALRSCVGVTPLIASEQFESLTKVTQRSLENSFSERERHLSALDKERADDQDYEKLMYDKLGLTKKGSLDYPDAPPPTPLKPQLTGSQRSFTRKLKGGLAKEFLPSPPPPTPKETINFCLPKEGREEKAEFMRKLIRSLSQEFSGKDAVGPCEVPEDERQQNALQVSPASGSELTESLCTNEKKVQDYFSNLVSGIVFSSAQIICGIVGESIHPKDHNEQTCHGVAFSNECQLNSQTLEKLNPCPSDVVILETERIPSENNGDKDGANFPFIMESKLWEYTDRLTQEIISSVFNFLNRIELLEYGEHIVERKGNGNKDCRHSCYIKQLNSMSEDLVKRVVQSALHLFKTQYHLQPANYASTVSFSQDDVGPVPAAELLQKMDPAARCIEKKLFLTGDNEEQQFIKTSLKTMKSGASCQAVSLCSDPVFTGGEQMAETQASACGIGIGTIDSSHEGTNVKNDSYVSSFSSPCPYKQQFVKVKSKELTGENQSCFVQAGTKVGLFEQKEERSCQHKDLDAFLDLNSEPIINEEEKSSISELTKVIMKDPIHKPFNKTYTESLAETILNSSLADVCKHCSSGQEVPTLSLKTDELHINALSVSNSSGEESPEVQQQIQAEELFKDREKRVPLILHTKFQGLNVIEYTGDSLTKQPQGSENQSTVALKQCSKEQEGSGETEHCNSLAPKAIELLLVNFNSVSAAFDVQVQAMLQWAVASQLNVSKIHIKNSSEDFVQFPTLLTLAEQEEWTVGDLLCAVLAFCESNQTTTSPTLFDYLLEPLHCTQAHSKPHRTSS